MIYDMLYPYQKESSDKIAEHRRIALFDEPGLGKTMVALGTMEQDGFFDQPKNALVLATRTGAALTWLPHADRLVPEGVDVVDGVRKSLAIRRRVAGESALEDHPTLVIANHEFVSLSPKDHDWDLNPLWQVEWDAVFIDESQRVLPTQAAHELAYTQFWRGLSRLKIRPTALRVPMSGTPDRGLLENRWGTWHFVLPEAFNFNGGLEYDRWLAKTFDVQYKTRYIRVRGRNMEITQPVVKGIRDEKAWHALDDQLTIRHTKLEVAEQLPPKRYIDIELPFDLRQRKAYDEYLDGFEATDDGSESAADMFAIRATQFATVPYRIIEKPGKKTRATAIDGAPSPKRDWIIDWLNARDYDTDRSKGQVVITSQFTSILYWLERELTAAGIGRIGMLHGDMTTNQRLASQRAFQSGELRIMLLSMTMGDSIDLDAADDMIFVDRVRDPDRVTQAEDRVHRVSRMHNVVIWRLITLGSVDEAIDRTNERRFNTTRKHMDGRRGVDYARRILARFAA